MFLLIPLPFMSQIIRRPSILRAFGKSDDKNKNETRKLQGIEDN